MALPSFAKAPHPDNFPNGKPASTHIAELDDIVQKFDALSGSQDKSEGVGRAFDDFIGSNFVSDVGRKAMNARGSTHTLSLSAGGFLS